MKGQRSSLPMLEEKSKKNAGKCRRENQPADSGVDTRGQNKFMFQYQDGPISSASCAASFNVTVSIRDDLSPHAAAFFVTEHVILMGFLTQTYAEAGALEKLPQCCL